MAPSPGLRGTSYPGNTDQDFHQPQRGCARNLFAGNPPLVVWLDCDGALAAQIREAAAPFSNITVKELAARETETWRAVEAAQDLRLPGVRDAVKDTCGYLTVVLLKTELVARSICEGDIPEGMASGWIDIGVSQMNGLGDQTQVWMDYINRWQGDRIRIPGLIRPESLSGSDFMAGVHWGFCGGLFCGPQELLLKFAGDALHTLRMMLARGDLTWEVNLWVVVYGRHPQWFSWYKAEFDVRMLRHLVEEEGAMNKSDRV